jgi:hypothetical protein
MEWWKFGPEGCRGSGDEVPLTDEVVIVPLR